MKFAKDDVLKMVKIAICLLLITAISTLLVAFVNQITKEPIAQQRKAKVEAALAKVLPAESYDEVNIEEMKLEDIVLEAYAAKDKDGKIVGYCIKTAPAGYGGAIEMITGVGLDGVVTGVDIVNMSETAGLGTKTQDEAWLAQYKGKTSDVEVTTKSEVYDNEISAVTGATVSSKAVTRGVKTSIVAAKAIDAANQVKGAA